MRTRLLAVLALAACAGCAADFLPESLVADLRILAVVADPPELGPRPGCTPSPTDSCYGTVALSVTAVLPTGTAAPVAWTFCPFSAGSQAGYACAVPDVPVCQPSLVPDTAGVVHADPVLLAAQCLAAIQQGGGLPGGVPALLPERAEVLFRARATDGAQVREAVYRLGIWRDGPPLLPDGSRQALNRNPAILRVRVGAAVLPAAAPPIPRGSKVEVCADLDPALVDPYLDAAGGRAVEQQVISFFATAGRFDFDRANGPSGCVKLEAKDLPAGQVDALLWVVARDLRGGAAVQGPWPLVFGP
jgi:hypothetical protein